MKKYLTGITVLCLIMSYTFNVIITRFAHYDNWSVSVPDFIIDVSIFIIAWPRGKREL